MDWQDDYPAYSDYDYPGEYFYNTDFGDAWRPAVAESSDERHIRELAEVAAKNAAARRAAPVAEDWTIKAQDCTHQFKGKEVGPECEEVVGFVAGEFTHRWLTLLRNEWAVRPMEAR